MRQYSGRWFGTFVTNDGRAVQMTADLKFAEDGSFAGAFEVYPTYPENNLDHWRGPRQGAISQGSYTPFGTIRFDGNQDATKFGTAQFSGSYELPTPRIGVIRGSVLIARGDKKEMGTMSLLFSAPHIQDDPQGGVWGN